MSILKSFSIPWRDVACERNKDEMGSVNGKGGFPPPPNALPVLFVDSITPSHGQNPELGS